MSNNDTQFSISSVIELCKYLGVKNQFILVEHSQENGQAEATNNIIFSEMKNNLDEAKGLWVGYLHEILCSYHTTPH